MALVPVGDAMYLWGESPGAPSHVIGLQIFQSPAGSGPELLDDLYAAMTDPTQVKAGVPAPPLPLTSHRRPIRMGDR